MPYFRNRFKRPNTNVDFNRVKDPDIKVRLENLLSNPLVQENPKTVEFMRSLLDQFNSRGWLSTTQTNCIKQNEERYSGDNVAEKIAAAKEWSKSFDEDKRSTLREVAEWYKAMADAHSQPYYYRETCEKVLNDSNFVPSQTTYEKIVNNKFAQRYISNKKQPAKFNVGDVIELNYSGRAQWSNREHQNNSFIIIEVTDIVRAAKDSRLYKAIVIGDDKVVAVEQRHIKKSN